MSLALCGEACDTRLADALRSEAITGAPSILDLPRMITECPSTVILAPIGSSHVLASIGFRIWSRYATHALCHHVQRGKLRLHVGRKPGIGRGDEINRCELTLSHVSRNGIAFNSNVHPASRNFRAQCQDARHSHSRP